MQRCEKRDEKLHDQNINIILNLFWSVYNHTFRLPSTGHCLVPSYLLEFTDLNSQLKCDLILNVAGKPQ